MSDTNSLQARDYLLQNLELQSPYGQVLAKTMRPFSPGEEAALETELAALAGAVATATNCPEHVAKIRLYLLALPDWSAPLERVVAGSALSDTELFALKQNLYYFALIRDGLAVLEPPLPEFLRPNDFTGLLALLDPDGSGSPSFYLADSFSPVLADCRARLRRERRVLKQLIKDGQQQAAATFGLTFNPAGEIAASHQDRDLLQRLEASNLFAISRESPTERYFRLRPSAAELESTASIEALQAEEQLEEERIRHQLTRSISAWGDALRRTTKAVAELDLLLAKAHLAIAWRATCPEIVSGDIEPAFIMESARHPAVEAELKRSGKRFTPISITLHPGVAVVTGANMGGKTVSLRTMGLLASLASLGMFVPAERCRTPLFTHIAMVTGEYRAFVTGLSRFGHEIAALCRVLPMAATRALLLVDEPAASTNPAEGSALAQAIAEHLAKAPAISVVTTHYDRLAWLSGVAHWQVVGFGRVGNEDLAKALARHPEQGPRDLADLMDYSLIPTQPARHPPREALRVAAHLGLPAEIEARAAALLRR